MIVGVGRLRSGRVEDGCGVVVVGVEGGGKEDGRILGRGGLRVIQLILRVRPFFLGIKSRISWETGGGGGREGRDYKERKRGDGSRRGRTGPG